MKSLPLAPFPRRVLALGALLALAGCATAPESIPEGLVLVKDTQADTVYARPGVDFGKYTQFYLLEPNIAFRADWESDMAFPGGGAGMGISSSDMERIISMGKKLLAEQFDAELKKGGFALVPKAGPHVLAVKASIADLYLEVPDPNNLAGTWGRTYSRSSGSATLEIELYDSVSGQLLARAHDDKDNENDGYSWRFEKNQMSNINDARAAFSDWAQMLVNGLKRAKAQHVPAPAKK
jgi:hypothetical protein